MARMAGRVGVTMASLRDRPLFFHLPNTQTIKAESNVHLAAAGDNWHSNHTFKATVGGNHEDFLQRNNGAAVSRRDDTGVSRRGKHTELVVVNKAVLVPSTVSHKHVVRLVEVHVLRGHLSSLVDGSWGSLDIVFHGSLGCFRFFDHDLSDCSTIVSCDNCDSFCTFRNVRTHKSVLITTHHVGLGGSDHSLARHNLDTLPSLHDEGHSAADDDIGSLRRVNHRHERVGLEWVGARTEQTDVWAVDKHRRWIECEAILGGRHVGIRKLVGDVVDRHFCGPEHLPERRVSGVGTVHVDNVAHSSWVRAASVVFRDAVGELVYMPNRNGRDESRSGKGGYDRHLETSCEVAAGLAAFSRGGSASVGEEGSRCSVSNFKDVGPNFDTLVEHWDRINRSLGSSLLHRILEGCTRWYNRHVENDGRVGHACTRCHDITLGLERIRHVVIRSFHECDNHEVGVV
mmetsp:Transcript_25045/g.36677  ORF Transcript_25045/g.36677 Transcript_25045/m.36677 type:complete len:458 (+) Transcript_25045:129-1502(+)